MKVRTGLLKISDHPATPYVVLIVFGVVMLSPFIWTVLSAFKTLCEVFSSPPTYFPENFTLDTMYFTWFEAPMPTYIMNSLIMCLTATVIIVIAGAFTAYALSKYQYKGSGVVLGLFLFSRTIPPMAMLLPYYLVLMWLGLINTRLAVILYLIYLGYPLLVWLLKGFFDSFPHELIESSIVDGCSRTGSLFRIVLPVAATGICAIAVVSFMWAWNEFFAPFLFIHYDALKPITTGVFFFVGDEITHWNRMSAAAIYAIIPSLIFFLVVQKYIVKGLTAGALKY